LFLFGGQRQAAFYTDNKDSSRQCQAHKVKRAKVITLRQNE